MCDILAVTPLPRSIPTSRSHETFTPPLNPTQRYNTIQYNTQAAAAKLDLKKKVKVEKVSAIMKSNGIPSLPPVVAPVSKEDLRSEMAAKAEKMHGESVERASNDLRQSFESKILTSISRDLVTLTDDQLKARVVG